MSSTEKPLANGNGSLKAASQPEEVENIFMFIPNQIGELFPFLRLRPLHEEI